MLSMSLLIDTPMQAILVYDVTSRKSFEGLEGWLNECAKYGGKNIITFVVGNQKDKERQVSEREGREWATTHNLEYE